MKTTANEPATREVGIAMNTKHKDDCKRVFSRYDLTCLRCSELANGSPARKGWQTRYYAQQAARLAEIKAHDCKARKCGPVCTFGDW